MDNLSLKEKLINEEDNLDQFNVNFMKKLLKEVPEDTVIFKFISSNITSKELIEGLDNNSTIATHYCGDLVRVCRDILKRQVQRGVTTDLNLKEKFSQENIEQFIKIAKRKDFYISYKNKEFDLLNEVVICFVADCFTPPEFIPFRLVQLFSQFFKTTNFSSHVRFNPIMSQPELTFIIKEDIK